MNERICLTDVPQKLLQARSEVMNVPYELHDLCDYLATIAANNLTPSGVIELLNTTLNNLKNADSFPKLPQKLIDEKQRILFYIRFFPLIVDYYSSENFANLFREHFVEIFGEAEPVVKECTKYIGVKLVKKGVIDITNKDKAEVLVSLYNNSHPHGNGYLEYVPGELDIDQARDILQKREYFDFLLGRVMNIDLHDPTAVTTNRYNMYNGNGAAERAVAQCCNQKKIV